MRGGAVEGPTLFILFGATGDLAQRLIIPALFRLFVVHRLPERFALLGVGRTPMDGPRLATHYHSALAAANTAPPETTQWSRFAARVHYLAMDAGEPGAYQALRDALHALEGEWDGRAERIFYMATPPQLFSLIARGLGQMGLCEDRERSRVVVEKPLGRDLASSRAIDTALRQYFEERQIYRIDHFLGKETVQNILALRFANPIFEPVWNRRYVDHVAITVAETRGVEERGGYYDRAGALRDMVQNHLMQLLSLVAMEPPVAYDAEDIRGKKLDVLRSMRPIGRDEVAEFAARGQYGEGWIGGREVAAYCAEPSVAHPSDTETFAALRLLIDNWRWQGVPFYLRTGKRMAADVSEISVRFKDVPHRAFPANVGINAQPVRLVVQIQPSAGVILKFTAKEPGFELRLRPVAMRFCYEEAFDKPAPRAYETLLWDVMRGDATLFMRADQVEAAWQLLEPVLTAWEETPPADFPNYTAGSWGPEAAELLVARDGRSWLTPTLVQRPLC